MVLQKHLDELGVREYLAKNKVPTLDGKTIGEIKEITRNTNSSFVFRVELLDKNNISEFVYVKWSPPFAKAFPDLAIDSGRVIVEGKFLQAANKREGLVKYLPKALWLDEENKVLIMSDVLKDGEFLHDILDKYLIYPWIGTEFGNFFNNLHNTKFTDYSVPKEHQDWWVNIGFKDYMTKGGQVILGKTEVLDLVEESDSVSRTILWADPMPKNIVIDGQAVRIMDFETVINWDVAYDLGCFIAHFALRFTLKQELEKDFNQFLMNFFKAYGTLEPDLAKRVIKYISVFMVHRTDGIDQYTFSNEEKDRIRKEAKELFNFKGKLYLLIKKAYEN
jgi:5-methylthioribose kinase